MSGRASGNSLFFSRLFSRPFSFCAFFYIGWLISGFSLLMMAFCGKRDGVSMLEPSWLSCFVMSVVNRVSIGGGGVAGVGLIG